MHVLLHSPCRQPRMQMGDNAMASYHRLAAKVLCLTASFDLEDGSTRDKVRMFVRVCTEGL
jgi:hypothetical protein